MGSCPMVGMSLARLYRASLWMEEDSLSAVATRMKPVLPVHVSGIHWDWATRRDMRECNSGGYAQYSDLSYFEICGVKGR